jgi:hypothetical protein
MTSTSAPAATAAGFGPLDDLRHRPAPGSRTRDSLFWQVTMPEEQLAAQVYLYLTDRGKTGYNVVVWGPDAEPVAQVLADGEIPDEMDLDAFDFQGLTLTQPELRWTADLGFTSARVRLEYHFRAIHDAFSYRQNPDGLPGWFAENRFEQTGHVTGFLEVDGRRVELDRKGHRDHSWGRRNWGVPHHWKWFVAYTESGRAINGWIWIAKGEWGFAGYVVTDGVTVPVSRIEADTDYDPDMTQRRIRAVLVDVTGRRTTVTLERFGLFRLPTHDRMATVIAEAACSATIDGEPGAGQLETHWPADYLHHLREARA